MSLLTAEMTVTASDVERDLVEVLETSGRLLGFYRLQQRETCAWLEDLFIHPEIIGTGQGRRLFQRACVVAREWGYGVLELESDPNAEPFYVHLGAVRVGTVASRLISGRTLPLLRFSL